MAKVTVKLGSSRVVTSAATASQITTATKLDNLSGIDTAGVQNGYTLVYDSGSVSYTHLTLPTNREV